MFPQDSPLATNQAMNQPKLANGVRPNKKDDSDPYTQNLQAFVADTRSQLSTLTGEIAQRNGTIQRNDAYIFGDLLAQSLDIPVGHDFTPVNWLRRVCEIRRTQTMGDGFTVV